MEVFLERLGLGWLQEELRKEGVGTVEALAACHAEWLGVQATLTQKRILIEAARHESETTFSFLFFFFFFFFFPLCLEFWLYLCEGWSVDGVWNMRGFIGASH